MNREGKKESERGVYMREHVQDAQECVSGTHENAYEVHISMCRNTQRNVYEISVVRDSYGQVKKSLQWMPWSHLAKKAVVSCEKPRGGAHIL